MQSELRQTVLDRLVRAGVEDAAAQAARIVERAAGDETKALGLADALAAGRPLGLLVGQASFLGVPILCAEGVLAPRLETELLGAAVLAELRGVESPRVIDMCCGSGNLACAIAVHRPDARVWAADLTDECVDLARRNATALELTGRVTVYQGDLFDAFGDGPDGPPRGAVDAVVCNPPYISTAKLETERAGLLDHEPRAAFDGGSYGIAIHQRVVRIAMDYLRPGGLLCFEIGLGQGKQVTSLFNRARTYGEVQAVTNPSGEPRVLFARTTPAVSA